MVPPALWFEVQFPIPQSKRGTMAEVGHKIEKLQTTYLYPHIPPSCLRLNHNHQPITVATRQRTENIIDGINIPLPYRLVQLHLSSKSAEYIRQRRQDLRLGQLHTHAHTRPLAPSHEISERWIGSLPARGIEFGRVREDAIVVVDVDRGHAHSWVCPTVR